MTEETAVREIQVDLEALMAAFEDEDYEQIHYLDARTGDLIPIPEADFEEEDLHPTAARVDSHPDRYLAVPRLDPDDVLEDLAAYVRDLPDEDVRAKLGTALREGLEGLDFEAFFEGHEDLAEGWTNFRRECLVERVSAWLARHGLAVNPPASEEEPAET